MARITFAKDQPIQFLSGTLGHISYYTRNGQTFVHRKSTPELPKNPTRQQRARFKRRTIIDQCVSILQSQITDIQEAIKMRPKIRDRISYLYKMLSPSIKARTKLQQKIISEYHARFSNTSSRL
jgi:hypothetical protein